MAEERKQEYNPVILGFSDLKGPIDIPLKEAREKYGRLPSSYGFVPLKKGREPKKGLNLELGKFIREILENRQYNFKGEVLQYFKSWHREYGSEFGFDVNPFLNMNDPGTLVKIVQDNQPLFQDLLDMDLKAYLIENLLIRKEIVNSIKKKDLYPSVQRILRKKTAKFERGAKRKQAETAVNRISAIRILRKIETLISSSIISPDRDKLTVYADEVAGLLLGLPREIELRGRQDLQGIRGKGIEFEYAARDGSYLSLGKSTGDCTADKRNFQADTSIENIFWTIFSWILDQNYQILKVYYNGEFIMKVHMLPLYVSDMGTSSSGASNFRLQKGGHTILALDAVETIRAFRDDLPEFSKAPLLEKREKIFSSTMKKILELAGKMGIERIYAEKFSNTAWVREMYENYPEIFLHVDHIQKIDQLEDVFSLARTLCEDRGQKLPGEVFMEIQMKNIYLSSQTGSRAPGVKSFAVIKGDPGQGIPMNKVIGV
ncbi:hypothetical protein [Desulfospira joergensenii]|uniref:hypothetical protein n=1 Tax=Desulfospira joergensenii TaxID=53329 RepID=UPI0003B54ADD|nr:hypothetical protein [Desulfospira joergensenii]